MGLLELDEGGVGVEDGVVAVVLFDGGEEGAGAVDVEGRMYIVGDLEEVEWGVFLKELSATRVTEFIFSCLSCGFCI